jgi:hypothetical protein
MPVPDSDFLFANNIATTLAVGISSGALSLTVTDPTGMPSPGMYEQFSIRVRNPTTDEAEIMYCVGRSGAVLTVDRAQEGTAPIAFLAGAEVTLPLTQGILEYLRDL